MNRISNIIKGISYFLAIPFLSGILVGTSYIPFNGWALFFCYLPLWFKVLQLTDDNKKFSQIFISAWFTQFILTLIGFNWVFYVSDEFGHLPKVLSFAALLSFATFMHLYIPISVTLSAALFRKFHIKHVLVRLLLLALSMSLIERIWPSIFEWNLGYSLLWMNLPVFQWADTVGFWGLSTWIFIIQACIGFAFFLFRQKQKKESLVLLAEIAVLFVLLNVAGYFKGKYWEKTDETVRIAVTQGNIGNAEKLQSEQKSQFHNFIIDKYSVGTAQLITKDQPELLIWPETALPMALDKAYHYGKDQKKILENVQNWGVPLVTGGYSLNKQERDYRGDDIIRNTVFYIAPNRDFAAPPYFKTNLLAFGEYMPLGETFPKLYDLLPFVGVYAKGSGPLVANVALKTKEIRLGPQICYDSLYPGFSRDLSKNGAQILFNVTNDAWFGWWAEPYQHGWMTLARAVEVRRPLVRSTNTGISTAILASGQILERSPINEPWAHTFEIKYKKNPPLTTYAKFGYFDWIVWLALFAFLIFQFRTEPEKGENV
jgi:apolipoprotein N-acyltransferase